MIVYEFFVYAHVKDIIKDYVENVHVHEMLEDRMVDVDWDYFDGLGLRCLILCAFKERELVGFSAFQVNPDTINVNEYVAENIMITAKKKYRGKVSAQLIEKANAHLQKLGVNKVNFLVENVNLGKFLKRKGFKPCRIEWSFKLNG